MKNRIEKSNVQDIFELSVIQKGMLFHYLKEATENLYNVQLSLDIDGSLDVNILQQAISIVQARNEVLRSVFSWEQVSTPLQIVLKEHSADFVFQDISGNQDEDIRYFVNKYQANDQNCRFDLTSVPIRFSLIKTSVSSFIFNITHHHILYDGWSTGILLRELFYAYHQLSSGLVMDFSIKRGYKEIIQAFQKKTGLIKSASYWDEYLKGYKIVPFFVEKHAVSNEDGETQKLNFSTSIEKMEAFSSRYKVTKAAIIYAGYGILLQKYNNVSDVVFGTTTSGRNPEVKGSEEVMGNFINTIPLRLRNLSEKSLLEVVVDVNEGLIRRQEFNDTPYFEIKRLLNIRPTENLFDSAIAVENYPLDEASIKGNDFFRIQLRSVYEKTDIPLMITVFFRAELEVELVYKSSTISTSFAQSFGNHFIKILSEILNEKDKTVDAMSLLSEENKKELLAALNFADIGYPVEKTIVDLFNEQAKQYPTKMALKFGRETMSYFELDQRSSRLASVLRKRELNANHVVGLLTRRSMETIVGMLAILKAGGAYLPIDIDYPEERIQYIISDSGTNLILTTSDLNRDFGDTISVLFIDRPEMVSVESSEISCVIKPSDLCYIIYTSGTTGNPKGVMVEHRNVVRLFFNDGFQFDFNSDDVWTMFHSPCFDFSVWEIYGALLFGGSVIIIPKMIAMDTPAYLKLLIEEGVTILNQTPSAFYSLSEEEDCNTEHLLKLRYVIFGGEALLPGKLKSWKSLYPSVKLINMFGITETTVHVTYKEIGAAEIDQNISNIGKPIPTLSVYIFDKYQKLAPKGVIGELYVGGAGVSRGYLGREELTNDKFILNPYDLQERLYRSGDFARILGSGDIEYLGRMDTQVQLRGFRIELGEIEYQLRSHGGIREVAVLIKEKGADKYLVAYYVAAHEIEAIELRRFLLERLPDYMVPAHYVHLTFFPLTFNSKLDLAALPNPVIKVIEESALPKNELQKGLVKIWAELLELEENQIDVNVNFFDIGGNSLMLVKMASRINKLFDVEVTVAKLFTYPVISMLADFLDSNENADVQGSIDEETDKLKQINETIDILNHLHN